MTSYDFAHSGCSWCHPGGGPLEYDREGYRYDGAASGLLGSATVNPMPKNGDYYIFGNSAGADASSYAGAGYFEVGAQGIIAPENAVNPGTMKMALNGATPTKVGKKFNSWVAGGVAEADCLMCHYANQYSQVDRNWAAPGYTAPKWSASLGLVGAKGQAGLLASGGTGTTAGDGRNPSLGVPAWSSNMVTTNMIVKAPTNEACSVCHFFDNAFTNKGPAGKPMGNTAWQKKFAGGSYPDPDIASSHPTYTNGNNIVDWAVAKGKPEGGKRAESINDDNNPDAHMKWPAYSGTGARMTCSICHYTLSGDFDPITTASGTVIYPALTGVQKIDHQFAKGDNLPDGKNMDQLDNTVTCASCHTAVGTHPNKAHAPIPGHAGFPAMHLAKLDCRVCHIPVVNAKSIWKVADFTVGPYRTFERNQSPENSLGVNAKPLLVWRKSSTSDTIRLEPVNTTVVPVWTDNSTIKPTYQRVAKSAAEAKRTADGYDTITNIASFALNTAQGGDTTLIVNTTAEITDMVNRVNTGAGISTAVMNFYINTFDISHNVMPKGGKCIDRNADGDTLDSGECNYILGSAEGGGCVMCHSSSNPSSPDYNSKSIGFFDRTHTLFTQPTQTDSACGNTAGMHQVLISNGTSTVKRVAVKLSTINSAGTPVTIDLSGVNTCDVVGNTLNQGEVLGYTADQLAALQSVMSAATATTVGRPAARISTWTEGTTITLNGSQSLNAVSWTWTTSSGTLSSTTASVTTLSNVATTGTHTVTLTVANSSGVTHKATIKVVAQASMLYTAPTASIDCSVLSSTVTCTDVSTAGTGDTQSELKIRIVWGDGNMSSVLSRGSTTTHTYADGTYTLYSSATGSTTKLSNTNADSRNIYGPFTTPGGITLGTISGMVSDNSTTVGGVVVSFYRTVLNAVTSDPTDTVTQLYTAVSTGTTGTYLASLPTDTYTVTASKGGYTFSTVTDAFVGAGTSTTRDFSALHTISGRIAGAPAGTVVELTNGAAGIVAATSTNANGTFTLSSGILTSGTYTVDPQPSTGTTSPDLVTGVTVTTLDRTGIDFTYYAP